MKTRLLCLSLGSALALATLPTSAFAAPPTEEGTDTPEVSTTAPPATTAPEAPAPQPPAASPIWENLEGGNVTLELDDQSTVTGEVKGVAGSDLLVSRTQDRRIVAVPTTRIGSVRARFEPKRDRTVRIITERSQSHAGFFAGGGVLVGLGATFVLAGVTTGALVPFLVYFVTLPVAGTGAMMIGAGVPLLLEGKRRRDAALLQTAGTEPSTLEGVTVLRF